MKHALPAALIGLCALGWTLPCAAASFDCEKAKTKVERLICGNEKISSLDDALYVQYHAAMNMAADPNGVALSQRDWLKARNRCADAACMQKAYTERIAALQKIPQAGWKTYRNEKLGIAFDYLANRQVKPCVGIADCVMLVGRDLQGSDYIMQFQVMKGDLKDAAESAGFELDKGKWMTFAGPGLPQEAQPFSGKGWKGFQATISCGVSDNLGFHAAGGECYWAGISNGRRAVAMDTQGLIGTDDATMRSVRSLVFLK